MACICRGCYIRNPALLFLPLLPVLKGTKLCQGFGAKTMDLGRFERRVFCAVNVRSSTLRREASLAKALAEKPESGPFRTPTRPRFVVCPIIMRRLEHHRRSRTPRTSNFDSAAIIITTTATTTTAITINATTGLRQHYRNYYYSYHYDHSTDAAQIRGFSGKAFGPKPCPSFVPFSGKTSA